MSLRNGRSKQACFQGENCRSGIAATKAGASGWASPRTHKSASVIDQEYPAKPARMLGSRPLSRTTAFAPRRDSRREKPFHQELPSLSVASPKHNPKLPILSISYLSRFLCPAFSVPLSLSRFPLSPAFRPVGSSVFQCVAVPLVAQKSEMAVRADRLADGHKSFIPKRFDCVP